MAPHLTLLALAVLTAWRPAETTAATPLCIALGLAGLVPWAWSRRDGGPSGSRALGLVAVVLAVSGLAGADPAGALLTGALAAAVTAVAWCTSRERAPSWAAPALALGIAALGALAVWQVAAGLDAAMAWTGDLPDAVRADAAARLGEGRAFASLILPGHLAALLAMALPLLVEATAQPRWRIPAALGIVLAAAGIVLSQSPVGAALAVAAVLATLAARQRRALLGAALLGTVVVATVVLTRPDLERLDPLRLRSENWRVAAWVWSSSPVTGVGFGGYGQASLAVPFRTSNLPEHAHCLPLEWMAELGVGGVALAVLAAFGLLGVVRRRWADRPALAAAVAVVPAHNLVDFSLWTSGVALPWAVVLGWALARPGARTPSRGGPGQGRAGLLALAAMAVLAGTFHLTSVEVGRSAAVAPDPDARCEAWTRSHRLAPWRVAPLFELGGAALEAGRPDLAAAAQAEIRRWRWLRPRSAALASLLARLDLVGGELPRAVVEGWVASRARPVDDRLRADAAGLMTLAENAAGAQGP